MTLPVAIQLGRVSNLPTVWSNTLAGVALAGGEPFSIVTLLAAIGLSLLYVAGMYLNDAFDREIDARERPSRPIPSGKIAADTVFAAGIFMLLGGIATITFASGALGPAANTAAPLSAVALGAAIVFYDWHHKGNVLSPFFMGLCRVLAYVTAGYVVAANITPALLAAALVSLSYLIGLTFAAKQEAFDRLDRFWPLAFLAAPLVYAIVVFLAHGGSLLALLFLALAAWIGLALFYLNRRDKGDVPRAVISLIAGISLIDAIFLAGVGHIAAAYAAIACFVATILLQRWVSGT
jgi:UbiA prenyltransferase family